MFRGYVSRLCRFGHFPPAPSTRAPSGETPCLIELGIRPRAMFASAHAAGRTSSHTDSAVSKSALKAMLPALRAQGGQHDGAFTC